MQTDKLNPIGQVFSVLGYVANHPLELLGNSINLSDEDFVNDFHKVVFNAINNLAIDSKGETDEVTPLAVDVYLANYPKYYQIWKQNDGPQFLSDAKETEPQFSFTHDYGLVKKFSVLRKYLSEGIDIKDIYDYDETNIEKVNDMNKRIEKMEVSEIVEHFTTKVINIRGDIELDNEDTVKFAASDDIESLLIRLNKEPVMGYPFMNPYYNTLFRGMQSGRFMLRSAKSGSGKAVALDTKIPLPDGSWITADKVEVGMELLDRKGKPTKVLAKFPQPSHMLYKVTTYDKREQILHPDHLMSVWTRGQKSHHKYNPESLMTKPLSEIMKDYEKPMSNGMAHKYIIPLADAVDYKEREHVIPPYAMGVLLGDGSLNEVNKGKLAVSFNEDDVLERFMESIGSTEYSHKDYNFTYLFTVRNNPMVSGMMQYIKDAGLNHTTENKYIPDEYLYDSIENRMELLRGLIDTDGYVGFSSGRNGYNVKFSTISEKLKDSFLTLVDGLGIGRNIGIDNQPEQYSTGVLYDIALFTDKKIWTSKKHTEHTGGHKLISNKQYGMPIMKIEEYKEQESVCFTVDNEEHLFLINDYIVTHNTRTAIKDLANASMTEFYDTATHRWVNSGEAVPTLFISTELNKDELQTILLAYVSGMTTAEIEAGNFTEEQKMILEHAVAIVKKSEMFFVYIEDFSAMDIQMIIEEYVIKHNIKFVVFDYIQNSPKLSKSFQDSFGHNLREDEILIELSRSLKVMSEKYNIFIISSTQLNGMADDDNIMVSRTGRALRGGSATVNKADYGIIMSKPTNIDIKRLQGLISEVPGFTEMPNFGHFIFKNRSGRSDMILWTKYDMGNMREKPLFITDFSYNLISDVPETKVNVNTYSASHEEVNF